MANDDDTLYRLEQALEAHCQALKELQEALLAELSSSRNGQDGGSGRELLSIQDICEELGMGKS